MAIMGAIAVSRFDDDIVGSFNGNWISHDGVVITSKITGESDGATAPSQLYRGRTENMTGATEADPGSACNSTIFVK
jgi:hypothetical protein